ncbi:V-type proton ATPase 116 kDa subunit a-like [Scaptodrosophila lebanonensis]|uniref:V-type proton ATPase subunit a n=1 Tax=Drosophila lebanonensis TaxID=7225 RepID=A0A6J2U4K4_DROLE|nr:V-type proton ATPase 116 kDa subunit a-like [Scaptodrosophila lebanonensis]
MFRSEPMSLCQLLIPFEAIYTTIAELGESGCMQFTDLNTNLHITQRSFFNEVLRCDELQRRLNYIAQQITKAELQLPEAPEDDDDGYNEPAAPNARQINEMEAQLEQVELELQELSRNGADIKRNYQELNEHKTVLEQLENFFVERASLNEVEKYLYYVTGVMPLEHYFSLERMIWRVTMGNVFFRRTDVMEEISDNNKQSNPRAVFVAFFHGEQLKERVFKICSGYHVVNHPCPLDANERAQLLTEIKVRMADMQLVLSQTDDHRNGVLRRAALYMHNWRTQLIKMQSIYHTMNNFSMDVSKKCLVGEGWTPSSDLEQLKAALQRGTQKAESSTPTIFQVVQPSVET